MQGWQKWTIPYVLVAQTVFITSHCQRRCTVHTCVVGKLSVSLLLITYCTPDAAQFSLSLSLSLSLSPPLSFSLSLPLQPPPSYQYECVDIVHVSNGSQ